MIGVSVVAFGLGGVFARRVKVLALAPICILALMSVLIVELMLGGSVEYGLKAGLLAVVCIQLGYFVGLSIRPHAMRDNKMHLARSRATVRTDSRV
jgi:hypothetical protein